MQSEGLQLDVSQAIRRSKQYPQTTDALLLAHLYLANVHQARICQKDFEDSIISAFCGVRKS